jgi:hypothetical protein
MADTIQTHRMTNLVSTSNPVLADGELIYNEVSKDLRIGDDATAYNSLARIDMAGAVTPYKSILTFATNDVCLYSGTLYKSIQNSNINNQPDTSPLYWEAVGAGGSGETFAMNWGYDVTTTAADPGAGVFRLNNATIASSTVMYINPEDADGIDASGLIEALTANDFQYLENVADPTEGLLIKIVSVVDNTGWYTVTYTVEGQASATTWTDAADFGVLFMFRGGSGGGHVIQDDGTGMTQRTNLNFIGFDISDDSGNDATVIELPAVVSGSNVLYDSGVLTTAAQTITVPDSALSGLTSCRIVIEHKNTNATGEPVEVFIDNDTDTSHYDNTYLAGNGSTALSGPGASGAEASYCFASSSALTNVDVHLIDGVMFEQSSITRVNGSTVEVVGIGVKKSTGTATDLTGMTIRTTNANGFGIGSRIRIIDPTLASGSTASSSAPASASSSGVAGTLAYDSSYLYVCTATDTWKRAALSTWS